MTKHDFQAALEWFNRANWDERVPEIHAIRHALLFAHKMTQEPSEGMTTAGCETWKKHPMAVVTQFKAMRNQALKEIEL